MGGLVGSCVVRYGIRVDRDALHADLLQRTVLRVHGHLFHGVECASQLSPVNDFAKDGIFAIEMWLPAVGNEELPLVCQRTCD